MVSGATNIVQKFKQSLCNKTSHPQFINLELSTARFRLNPDDEFVLFYEADIQETPGDTLKIDFIMNGDQLELVVWTDEDQMFFSDGRPVAQDFDPT